MHRTRPRSASWQRIRTALLTATRGRSAALWLAVGSALVAGLGLLDYRTGVALSFSLFYLVPIAGGTWFAGRKLGTTLALLATVTWYLADTFGRSDPLPPGVGLWNSAIRFGFFIIVTLLLGALRQAFAQIEQLTRTDPLTGARNLRAFRELLDAERRRSRRNGRAFTLMYVDVDDFKRVNDTLGHATGDELLRRVVATLASALRGSDLLARIGGDEFALLLPETGAEEARTVSEKLAAILRAALAEFPTPVTVSVGVATFEPDADADGDRDPLEVADALMYQAKRAGKAQAAFSHR